MSKVFHRTGQLYFKEGKFFERVRIGCNEWSYYDEELQDITEEVVSAIRNKLGSKD